MKTDDDDLSDFAARGIKDNDAAIAMAREAIKLRDDIMELIKSRIDVLGKLAELATAERGKSGPNVVAAITHALFNAIWLTCAYALKDTPTLERTRAAFFNELTSSMSQIEAHHARVEKAVNEKAGKR